jgi:hypothetical protein
MKQLILAGAFAALAGPANVSLAAANSPARTAITVTHLGKVTTMFSCGRGSNTACNYLILNSVCQDTLLADGTKERTCRYSQAVPPFQLKAGETKTVANLPADFLYTMKGDRMPTVEECIAAPMPH